MLVCLSLSLLSPAFRTLCLFLAPGRTFLLDGTPVHGQHAEIAVVTESPRQVRLLVHVVSSTAETRETRN